MHPLIAIPGRPVETGAVKGWPSTGAVAAPLTYLSALRKAGGQEAVLHPFPIDEVAAKELLERFDGLLLLGGGDIHPSNYGQETHPRTYGVSTDRDSFELSLVRAARSSGVPLLAICRGLQVLNVALGGTLHQHIAEPDSKIHHGFNKDDEWSMHPVAIEEESALREVVGASRIECSSHHHQAIDALADGLVISARADDEVIEAVETRDHKMLGVQWHPEMTAAEDPAQQALFDWIVNSAREKS